MTVERIGVVVVSWNTRDLLRAALTSIQAAGEDQSVRTYVVDNASEDGSPAMVRAEFPHATLIENPRNEGFGSANNRAFEVGGEVEDAYLLLNSDAELCPGALAHVVNTLNHYPRCGAVGARLVNPDGSFQASYARFPTLRDEVAGILGLTRWVARPGFPTYDEAASRHSADVDWVGGACMLVRSVALREIGGFDTGYHMYSEEMDLCRRLRDQGWSIRYEPAAVALHHGGRSTDLVPERRAADLWSSRLQFHARHASSGRVVALRVVLGAAYAARAMLWSAAALLSKRDKRRQKARSARRVVRVAWGV